jgi:hypothetical protein
MKTKQVIFSLMFVFGTLISNGQVKIEAQIGGSNFFYGLTINTAFDIPLSKNGDHILTPSIGNGFLPYFWDNGSSSNIIHTGLNYSYKRIGFGVELSKFSDFLLSYYRYDDHNFVDMIVYPNANYTIIQKQHWYLGLSAGAYIAFSRYYKHETGKPYMSFEGDIIPGAGVTIGYKFCK